MQKSHGVRIGSLAAWGLLVAVCAWAVHTSSQRWSEAQEPGRSVGPVASKTVEAGEPLASAFSQVGSESEPPSRPSGRESEATSRPPGSEPKATKRGLVLNTDAACPGYTLFAPLNSTTTYLVDLQGQLVHSWPSKHEPGQAAYLLDDGSLLRAGREIGNRHFGGGGIGGRLERISLDGKVVWEFVCADESRCQHHDIKPLPNGHVLLIAWEKRTREQALAAGRDPEQMTGDEMWPDCVLEMEPEGAAGGKIVWEWHVWDHLVQDFDESKANYGVVAEHPELVDVNYLRTAPRESPEEMRRLQSLGYVGGAVPEGRDERAEGPGQFGPGPGGPDMQADWCHTNSIDYNAKLDQIVVSVHTFNEIWIIDHSTSKEEAAGHRGGRGGKGGDLLYRWGNPRAYGAGGAKDQTLFAQHDARWIPEGFPGAGHLTAFNNGAGRPGEAYSSVVEIELPVDAAGKYRLERGKAFGPAKPSWEYTAAKKMDFYSSHISGAERLRNGNTLVCSGEQGRVFEVTADGRTVWDYVNPYSERSGLGGLLGMFVGGPRPPSLPERRLASDESDGPMPGSDDPRRPPPGAGPASRPAGPPGRGGWRPRPGGPWGPPPGGGPGGPPGGGAEGLFRATRLPPDGPGVRCVLQAKLANQHEGR